MKVRVVGLADHAVDECGSVNRWVDLWGFVYVSCVCGPTSVSCV